MAKKVRRGDDLLVKIYRGQNETIEATVTDDTTGGDMQTEPWTSDVMGTSSAPFFAQSVPPRPTSMRAMPVGMMVNSQPMWEEAMKKLATLKTKVLYIEGGVKPWVEAMLADQDIQV